MLLEASQLRRKLSFRVALRDEVFIDRMYNTMIQGETVRELQHVVLYEVLIFIACAEKLPRKGCQRRRPHPCPQRRSLLKRHLILGGVPTKDEACREMWHMVKHDGFVALLKK